MTDKIISPPEPVSTPISWTEDKGGGLVFTAIQAKTQFTVDVVASEQVSE